MIFANSPQAKGRIERSNRTLQDRLVKELRLNKISTIEEANAFLPSFIEDFNRRFAVVPEKPNNAHKQLLPEHDLKWVAVACLLIAFLVHSGGGALVTAMAVSDYMSIEERTQLA